MQHNNSNLNGETFFSGPFGPSNKAVTTCMCKTTHLISRGSSHGREVFVEHTYAVQKFRFCN